MQLSASLAERLAELILPSLHREYPNKIAHVMTADQDARPPRELTPAFFGCFDWHSAVHSHWSIARLLRFCPDAPWAPRAVAALDRSLTAENIAGEVSYIAPPSRTGFEMPYGMAWLLTLAAELAEHDATWSASLEPLASLAEQRFARWIERLPCPIRAGQHPQSAFALGLSLDAAHATGREPLAELIRERSLALYADDTNGPIAYEPSAYDFLSPCLAEADLLARIMERDRFETWFDQFLPSLTLSPVIPSDRADGKLVHLDGLNLSRAWMLRRIGTIVGREELLDLARVHREAGMASLDVQGYEGGHWLGTFALYGAVENGG